MKKLMKRIGAVLMAVAMMAALGVSAWAADATNNLTTDVSINVKGLETNDKVDFYRVLEYNQDAVNTGGWVATAAFKYDATNNPNGLTDAEIQRMLGLKEDNGTVRPATAAEKAAATGEDVAYGISGTLAAKIAKLAQADGVNPTYADVAVNDGIATKANPSDGLYLALVEPGQAGTVYNPIFVGADYQQPKTGDDVSSNWTVNMEDTYSPTSMAKKSHITVDKTAKDSKTNDSNDSETVAVGDELTFTVKTTIPEFADNYTKAVFNVTDVLSNGLKLDKTSVKVYLATVTEGTYTKGDPLPVTTSDRKTYTIPTDNLTDTGYKVVFDKDYLLGLTAEQPIWIEYKATVQDTAIESVNVEDNTVTINYSNTPTDETGKGTLKDETKHYTFDIDANLFGTSGDSKPWQTVEVVKVGLDKDGKEITAENVTWHDADPVERKIGALEGAEFKLYVAATDGTTELKDKDNATVKANVYTNGIYNANTVIVSDSTGRLTIKDAPDGTAPGIRGLDAGVYYLVETKAPAGYIKEQKAVKIEIKTEMQEVTYTDETDPTVTWKVNELKSYSIEMNGVKTAEYTFTNELDQNDNTLSDSNDVASQGDNIVGKDGLIGDTNSAAAAATGKIQNVQGTELPSTGGIGTYVFTVAGVAIMAIAAGLLIVRHKKKAE